MDRKQLNNLSKKRDGIIEYVNFVLENRIKEGQQNMLNLFTSGFADILDRDEKGNIINNARNRGLIGNIDKVFLEYSRKNNAEILSTLTGGVSSILDFNTTYYSNFATKAELLPLRKKVIEQTKNWLGINGSTTSENGYLSTLINSDIIKNQIKDFAIRSVNGQQGSMDAKRNLQELIIGDGSGSLGALQKYHRNFAYDLFSQVDRATAKTYADDLKLDYAIYEGGIIKTSREFCKDHNGNVYHKTEIEKFNPKVAMPPNYNPFTDLGGYGCRHTLNWIPTSLALVMRPDARKFEGVQKAEKTEEKKDGKNTKANDATNPDAKIYDDLIKKAEKGGQQLSRVIEKLLKKHGGYATPLNFKTKDSIYRKVTTELDNDIDEVKDAVRATIILPKKKRDEILKDLESSGLFARIKNQTADKFSGYSGILTNVKLKSGIFGEVQFNTEKMIFAKEKPSDAIRIMGEKRWNEIEKETGMKGGLGHDFYEKMRVLDRNDPAVIILDKQSREYYKNFYDE